MGRGADDDAVTVEGEWAAAAGSAAVACSDVVEKLIRVLREPGVALGMSVAGGGAALPLPHDHHATATVHDQVTTHSLTHSLTLSVISL